MRQACEFAGNVGPQADETELGEPGSTFGREGCQIDPSILGGKIEELDVEL